MSWLSYAAPTIIEQAKVVGLLSAMLWLFQTVLLHSEVNKPDQARHAMPNPHTHAHLQPSDARLVTASTPSLLGTQSSAAARRGPSPQYCAPSTTSTTSTAFVTTAGSGA